MEKQYLSYGDIQNYIKQYYAKNNKKTNVIKALKELNGLILKPSAMHFNQRISMTSSWSNLTDDQFIAELLQLPFAAKAPDKVTMPDDLPISLPETNFFSSSNDVLVFPQFRYIEDPMHSHDFFEMFYLYKGSCQLRFESELRTLCEGNLCIIAPDSQHSLIHDDESATVITISIKKSTFESSFFQQLTQKNILSGFFRNVLFNKTISNYMLFSTDNSTDIKLFIRNLILEYYKGDSYSNHSCNNWINLLFSFLLRSYSDSIQFYHYEQSVEPSKFNEFYSIFKYIQYHYRTLTLNSLAETFHYSEAYMSILLKKHTGLSFIQLITKLKMSEACEYLRNTDLSVEKIAMASGYHSSNHFSKTFKEYYNCSPQQYRQQWNV